MLFRSLSDADKLVVNRARKVQRFMSQPFSVAEQFTGQPGKYVTIDETVRSFREILDGKHDDIPEDLFLLSGGIDDVLEKFEKRKAEQTAKAEAKAAAAAEA